MDNQGEYVLLIESGLGAATLIRDALAEAKDGTFFVDRAESLSVGLERLNQEGLKAILLNLYLSDSQGIETFDKLYQREKHIPILIMTTLEHEDVARLAIQRGAQDYLLIEHSNCYPMSRAIRNVMERKIAEDALFIERERAQVTLNSIGDAVISTDLAGNVTYLNAAAERMTGWSQAEAQGQPFTTVFCLINGATREPLPSRMELAIEQNKPVGLPLDSVLIRRDGTEVSIEDSAAPIRDRGSQVIGAVIVFHDVTAARSMVLKMIHFAQHDFLTDLPNRLLLNDRLAQTISIARRRRKKLAVLFIDVDRFKNINDTLGHLMGDKLLQSIAKRLSTCVRDSDTISRQGGDEFVLLLADVEHTKAAGYSAAKILSAMTEKHCIAEHDIHVTLSIGISVFPEDGEDAETLLRNADAAMYHAKESGRNNYQFFKQGMNDRAAEQHSLEGSLRHALARREFILHYQPKVNLKTGAITGAEVLLRWMHPVRGLLYPDQFVPIAEDSGLIVPIGRWVRRQACQQAQAWQNAGLRPTPIAVNISAIELRSEGFLAGIRDTLKETGLDPRYLEIELTESVLIHDVKSTMIVLHALKAMGVQLAIDDFGTGYSSLSYLRQFPIDTLKIDQSFVREIDVDHGNNTIVSAVIRMCNSLNLRVSAEGVETPEQLAFLQAEHCEEGQGFYFSAPIDAGAFAELRGTANTKYPVN
jgi:diguanylate cyclase (GGDEF)-like protein/PAS domain S-box-containing protein